MHAAEVPAAQEKLVVINAPQPDAAIRYARQHPGQLLRSSCAGFFQLPHVPEALLRAKDFFLLRRTMAATSAPGTFSSGDLARYCEAWSTPDALTAMINWYRAFWRQRPAANPARIRAQTLILWGRKDAFLQPPWPKPASRIVSTAEYAGSIALATGCIMKALKRSRRRSDILSAIDRSRA